jgi:DNA-binding NtrC family response regulator
MAKILCLDDDPDLLYLHKIVLERAGYEVLSASNADDALELLHSNPIDMVITDHVMPGRSGEQFIADMKKLRPNLPVLLLSGMPGGALESSAADAVMQKTEGSKAMLNKIEHLLRSHPRQ